MEQHKKVKTWLEIVDAAGECVLFETESEATAAWLEVIEFCSTHKIVPVSITNTTP